MTASAPAAGMLELFSIRDVARIFALQESRLRYWMQTGFVGPTVRKGGRFYYRFADVVAVKAAKDLIAAGLPLQKVRKNLEALRKSLPADANPTARLRICSDGETIVALEEDVAFQPLNGQIVMAFTVPTLCERMAEVLALEPPVAAAPPPAVVPGPELATQGEAYRLFHAACAAEEAGEFAKAESLYQAGLEHQPILASALSNLGNLLHQRGALEAAQGYYERALELEPGLAEARYNLANTYQDLGRTELAMAELRRLCATNPDFPDAHFNLALMLLEVGGKRQATSHLEAYLALDASSVWAAQARDLLAGIGA